MRFKDIFSLIMVTLFLGVIAFGAFWVSSRLVPDDKYYIKATEQYERVKGGDLVLSKEETLKFFRHSAEIEKTYYESFKLLSEALHWSAIFLGSMVIIQLFLLVNVYKKFKKISQPGV